MYCGATLFDFCEYDLQYVSKLTFSEESRVQQHATECRNNICYLDLCALPNCRSTTARSSKIYTLFLT